MLANHYEKIDWQLKRIYRARNIATHIGQSMPNTQQLVNRYYMPRYLESAIAETNRKEFFISMQLGALYSKKDYVSKK